RSPARAPAWPRARARRRRSRATAGSRMARIGRSRPSTHTPADPSAAHWISNANAFANRGERITVPGGVERSAVEESEESATQRQSRPSPTTSPDQVLVAIASVFLLRHAGIKLWLMQVSIAELQAIRGALAERI